MKRVDRASRVILLGCVKEKRTEPSAAKDLYRSPLWKGRRAYAEGDGAPWLILSALHGLVDPEQVLRSYDLALTDLPAASRRAWGKRVLAALEARFGDLAGMTFEVHAGAAYRASVGEGLELMGAAMVVPLEGLSLGRQLRWYREQERVERRRVATDEEVQAALDALDRYPSRVAAHAWPGDLVGIDSPGLYSWWVDAEGASDLTEGLGHLVAPGWIYAGLTGATKWPSGTTGKATLRSRIGGNHLRGRVRGSTFRLTLAAALRDILGLAPTGPKALTPDSEHRLNAWIAAHLEVAVFEFPNADALTDLEHRVLATLDPPLNLDAMSRTALRVAISESRAALESQTKHVEADGVRHPITPRSASRLRRSESRRSPSRHR